MVSNYASGRKHAKHRYILAVNLTDTFRCPKRQIATKKYKIICLSSMFYLNQKKSNAKYNLRTAFSRFAPQLTIRFKQIFDLSRMAWHTLVSIPLYLTSLSVSLHLRYLCLSDFSSNHSKIYPGMLSVFYQRVGHSLFTFHSQIRYPDRTKFHAIVSLFLRKCLASREAVVSINFSANSANQNK